MKKLNFKIHPANILIFCDNGTYLELDISSDYLAWADTTQEAIDGIREDIIEAFGNDIDAESLDDVLRHIEIKIDNYFIKEA